ncbi:MAG: NADH-quinone oxidoreductase subunit C [Planctomycetota bacterium]|nr:NADH-quinone oxidoreductase subunit C [Planctomycetota bacterium]
MRGQAFLERLKQNLGEIITGSNMEAIDPWIEVSPAGLRTLCKYLKNEPDLQFDMLNCISGVDYFEPDAKKAAKVDWQPHTEVVYHLWSVPNRMSLVLKVMLPRWKDDRAGEIPELDTVSDIWRTADWHEREVYDLSGIHFVGHPNLRRILCPEDWVGYPLRRDYEMPLEYHGIRGR